MFLPFLLESEAMKSLLIVFCVVSTMGFAQDVERQPFSTWFTILNKCQFNQKWSASMELHERFGDFFQTQGSFILRPSLDYKFNEEVTAFFGYSFVNRQSYDPYNLPGPKNEHNIWEQILLKNRIGKAEIQHRFRQEHRWIDRYVETSNGFQKDGKNFSNRFRYRMTFIHGLKTLKNDHGIFIQIFDEFWVSQGNGVLPQNFARNWMYFGLGYAFTPDMNIQTGFMHQYDRVGEGEYIFAPILQSSFVYNF